MFLRKKYLDLDVKAKIDIYVANKLLILLQCKTIIDGKHFGEDNIKYWNIIFDKGKLFLADDLETEFYGDEHGKLKIIRKMNF